MAERRLAEVARRQLGVFSRKQANLAGLSSRSVSRRVVRGAWTRVLPGVYRAASTPESWRQKLLAGCLWAGEDAVISHRTAARLLGLEGLPPMRPGEAIELTVPFGIRKKAPGFVVHQSRKLEPKDRRTSDGIAVTSLARTLVDVSAMLDERRLSMALDSGLARHRFIDIGFLRREHRRLATRGRKVSRALGRLLKARAPNAVHLDSALERRFSALIRGSGLPQPREHYEVPYGGRRVEVDFAYPGARLAIELDGAAVHLQKRVWERDAVRRSVLAAAGWRVVPVTSEQLDASEAAVLERIASALRTASA
jgi:very-short-patch-repair endonuclease